MKTSVAMCTYNGAKFIKEQLESILNQSHPVDEIIICDDGSTDNTLTILDEMSLCANVIFHVYINETKLGAQKNFEKAISLCQGDIILLSDQDDIWEPQKVKTIIQWFQNNPTKEVVFTNASLIDQNGNTMGDDSIWNRIQFTPKEQFWFRSGFGIEIFGHGNVATGASMAIKNTSCRFVSVLPNMSIYHVALLRNSLGYINTPLIRYRLHDSQVCGLEPINKVSAIKPFWNEHKYDNIPDYIKFQPRLEWGEERLKSKHYWFGGFVLKHFGYYLRIYGIKCGLIVIVSDMLDSYSHSFHRILNKLSHLLNKLPSHK